MIKRDFIGLSRTPEELALMRKLKVTLDPKNILNPGKIFKPRGNFQTAEAHARTRVRAFELTRVRAYGTELLRIYLPEAM